MSRSSPQLGIKMIDMSLSDDISVESGKFTANAITDQTKHFNEILTGLSKKGPRWWEIPIDTYRQMRETGETPLPKPVYLAEAKDDIIPSRETGRDIPIRVYRPDNGEPSKGLMVHYHGGGFVLSSHRHSDSTLQLYANSCQLTVVSIGYRLAPEHPWPAPFEDCFDAILYLADQGPELFEAPLMFACGESAGALASVQSVLHLVESRPGHQLLGVMLLYGTYDLSLSLPSAVTAKSTPVVDREALMRFNSALCPGMDITDLRRPSVSALYADLAQVASKHSSNMLPPALFICGTLDPLLDENVLMSIKWKSASVGTIGQIYPGAPHAFTTVPDLETAKAARKATVTFVRTRLTNSS